MPLDPKQRPKLLMADRTGDVVWIAAAIERLLASDPDIDLFEIEAAFREAAPQPSPAFLRPRQLKSYDSIIFRL